ncbi:SDR family oxidoreductase [Nocardioides immobilis]|uniref:SDR family oxidoreductase n=1 Tax=Nocardioides immobilis TaxID=2049295 RepID=A0A417XTL4_9ACTN|nr:SDR family oxidoreductase [Nocardioides immobilis]RHW23660.1 SDR family oxidoreductase [Nocardioides immobilis]
MTNDFEGKVALITGAGAGIGRAVVLRLAEARATIVGVDRDAVALAETAGMIGGRMTQSIVDLTDPVACASVVADAVEAHGRLDILGNIAGMACAELLADVTIDQYRRMMAVNADAPFFLTQAAMPHLVRSNGSVISLASTAGVIGQAFTSTYCMSKAAVIQMTKALAMEFLKTGVRINAIAPGGINTPLIQNFTVPDGVDMDLMGRYAGVRGVGEPEDVAALFAFLVSDEGKGFHGAVLNLDHGVTAG